MSDTAIAHNNTLDTNDSKPDQSETNDTTTTTTNTKADPTNDHKIKDNGKAEAGDEPSPAKKLKLTNDVNDDTPNATTAPTPVKPGRQPKSSKRLNILEKTAKEGEAMLQNMGHKAEDDDSNRRRTRSQTRGTPAPSVVAPPKKTGTPKTPTKDSSTGGTPKRRGRPPKNAVNNNSVENKTEAKTNSEQKTEDLNEKPSEETKEAEKAVNNSNETNDTIATVPSEEPSKESTNEKPTAAEKSTTEQTNDLSAKTNSISEDTSNSAPVVDTQQPTTE